jgi:hypothetical protein
MNSVGDRLDLFHVSIDKGSILYAIDTKYLISRKI